MEMFFWLLVSCSVQIWGQVHTPPGYELIEDLSDEFDGNSLDENKWTTQNLGWRGRQPGLFDPSNVVVNNGTLQLWAHAAHRNDSWPPGYDNYTTAAIHSVATVRQGFFEIRWRSGSSGISSSWWFHGNSGGTWTEIDVFETTGVDNLPEKETAGAFPSHVHVFALPGINTSDLPAKCGCQLHSHQSKPCSSAAYFNLPTGHTFTTAFHTASLNWTDSGVVISLDGKVVNTIPSHCLPQEIGMDFDRETMPGWMALPPPDTLPDHPFEVDYVRSYKRV